MKSSTYKALLVSVLDYSYFQSSVLSYSRRQLLIVVFHFFPETTRLTDPNSTEVAFFNLLALMQLKLFPGLEKLRKR